MDSDSIARFAEEVEVDFVSGEDEEIYHVNLEKLSSGLCEINIHHESCSVVKDKKISEKGNCFASKKKSFWVTPVVGVGKLLVFYSRFYFLLSLEHIKTRIGCECYHCRDMIPEKDKKVLRFHGFLEET